MAAMGELAAESGNIRPSTSSAAISNFEMNVKPTTTPDEDDSSMSSSATEIFDPSESNTKGQWGYDSNGTWRRHGSSESATSTGLSSISSSVGTDDRMVDRTTPDSHSKKRMADGTLKHILVGRGTGSAMISAPIPLPQAATTIDPIAQTALPKRRGRPPKDKPATVGHAGKVRRASMISKLHDRVRPRSSIPAQLPKDIFASECIEAAQASRLDPYALHPGEHQLLADMLMNKEVTIYLNIRNAVLRLWTQNPLCSVTPEEAAGCAKEGRFFGLAEVAYKWLVRNSYINFGCLEIPKERPPFKKSARQKTVVVIGAGVSGLTTARQLEGLFAQYSERWTDVGESPPRVIILEGRKRIGGRVYSKPLRSQVEGSLPGNLRNTVEMGAMIVTGFEHGNPLDTVMRGQLGLHYHLMTDALTIYDIDGKPVDEETDMINTELYTDISDRTGEFRAVAQQHNTLKGDDELIDRARDPIADGFEGFQLEPLFPVDNAKHRKPVLKRGRRRNAPPGTEKLTGRSRVIEESGASQSAARAAKTMGWQLKEGVAKNQSVSLLRVAQASLHPTLGTIMDEAIEQYQGVVKMTPQDMRLLNWHHANLEYANAAPVSSLSLSGHDQDTGNEFEGAHSEIIGGYTQLPRGLMNLPTKLDVRFDRVVESVHYNDSSDPDLTTKVVCTSGEVIHADEVVITAPLGVLKSDAIDFDPPLPGWKQGAISRLGFGLLNKIVLLYDKPFWDDSRDMFGLLNEADQLDSLNPAHYAQKRGRFYLIWNASKISGRPMLVALMAGHSAHEAETMNTNSMLNDINKRLRKTFAPNVVPAPTEVIVTRWKRDPFARGTYSYVAPETRPGDYDYMAEPVGNLHFAGEATCGTHPATVHGAFLSGLRVAADVMNVLAGPITLPNPLVGPLALKTEPTHLYSSAQVLVSGALAGSFAVGGFPNEVNAQAFPEPIIKQEHDTTGSLASIPQAPTSTASKLAGGPPRHSVCARDRSFWVQPAAYDSGDLNYEANIMGTILSQLGERPPKPKRPGVNPFILYTKAIWDEVKAHCSSNDPLAGRDAIRQTIGKWWREASAEVKAPYLEASLKAQELADGVRVEWETNAKKWDEEARVIRGQYVRDHPATATMVKGGGRSGVGAESMGLSKRKTNVSNCVVLDHA
ncbi:hypothetical protein LTR91_009965 [Friedmanniomyces endolithicus]|uniref:SWIRM domain-containing protein n=1 Tax=Friedmanniomyces endolithicus TaxID=329885 RepID=A0AAN6KJU1_9PEZI|nr:hypothetical protein LTR59_006316 [Friedmanniomyces endolithicus]KAK0987153.1 hypothetical protein LTR91_009965 [Friedmanniomyces endolithicus]KAK0993455.1 hypothetical protein LTS01_007398 [Friedmanniomyces endolithicus]